VLAARPDFHRCLCVSLFFVRVREFLPAYRQLVLLLFARSDHRSCSRPGSCWLWRDGRSPTRLPLQFAVKWMRFSKMLRNAAAIFLARYVSCGSSESLRTRICGAEFSDEVHFYPGSALSKPGNSGPQKSSPGLHIGVHLRRCGAPYRDGRFSVGCYRFRFG
jgi:hypothetical protein